MICGLELEGMLIILKAVIFLLQIWGNIMKAILCLIGVLSVNNVWAIDELDIQSNNEQPTVIYGEAENPDGTFNQISVEQAADAPNPFGNPIVDLVPYGKQQSDQKATDKDKKTTKETSDQASGGVAPGGNVISATSQQNPQISPENSPEEMQNELQNTLYESGGRIYDLQSYPDSDINQIENEGNAVTNYPEY